MKHSDYPSLFQIADKGSTSAQKYYLKMIKIEFSVLIIAAIFSNIAVNHQIWRNSLTIAVAVLLFIALCSRIIAALAGLEKKWFSCRAIAESVKSLTWRYITRTKLYGGEAKSKAIDSEFLKDLKEIRNNRLEGAKKLGKQAISGYDITERMRAIRSMSFNERKSYYNDERVIDQKEWYSKHAKMNERRRFLWFWGSLCVEAFAVVLAFLLVYIPLSSIKPIGILTTLAAVMIAWSQIKKYGELSQSYCLVIQELGLISSMYIHVDSEEKLSDYVENAEDVISKEHIMWLAKREH